ncbi:hypothetical protein BHM03_00011092 [Ensete ventricosum]|nr:hypothetical protein BHM03_00011092 [Ensete ventricosum]
MELDATNSKVETCMHAWVRECTTKHGFSQWSELLRFGHVNRSNPHSWAVAGDGGDGSTPRAPANERVGMSAVSYGPVTENDGGWRRRKHTRTYVDSSLTTPFARPHAGRAGKTWRWERRM